MAKVKMSVDTHNILRVIGEDNAGNYGLSLGVRLMDGLLERVSKRAVELNDDKLNYYMFRLGLYEKDGEALKEYERLEEKFENE